MGASLIQYLFIIYDEGNKFEALDGPNTASVERGSLERGAVEALRGELHRFYSITY